MRTDELRFLSNNSGKWEQWWAPCMAVLEPQVARERPGETNNPGRGQVWHRGHRELGQRGRGTTHLSASACRGPLSLQPGLLGRLRRCQLLLPSHKQDVCPCCHMQSHGPNLRQAVQNGGEHYTCKENSSFDKWQILLEIHFLLCSWFEQISMKKPAQFLTAWFRVFLTQKISSFYIIETRGLTPSVWRNLGGTNKFMYSKAIPRLSPHYLTLSTHCTD